METYQYKNWWFVAVNGIIAVLLGLMLLLFTEETLKTMVIIFGLIVLLVGVSLFLASLYYVKKDKNVGMIMIQSIASIVIGLIIMIFTEKSVKVFLMVAGTWAIIVGVFQVVILLNVRKHLANPPFLLANALLTIVLGVIMFFYPIIFASFICKLIGGFAVLFGIIMIYLAFVIRKIKPIG